MILEDSDGYGVLACALSAQADYIVSGDSRLLDLHQYQSISILTVSELLEKAE